MERSNVLKGVLIGAAVVGAVYLIRKRGGLNLSAISEEATQLIERIKNRFGGDPMSNGSHGLSTAHDGQHLASKIRHKVERMASSDSNL